MTRLDDVARALGDRAPLRRTDAEVWREEPTPEDSAPSWQPERPNAVTWGRTQEEARDLLRRQMCPVCGEGPWKSPLNHAAKRHGIRKYELREACGMNTVESVIAPDLAERFSANQKVRGQDMRSLSNLPRRKYRTTSAGRSAVAANLVEWEAANPESAREARSRAGTKGAAAKHGRRGAS